MLKFYTRDFDLVLRIYFYFGTSLIIFYLIIIPESPKWLFIKEGSSSKKAIDILNYIAWFNGSDFRVPYNAQFDIIGQVIKERETIELN